MKKYCLALDLKNEPQAIASYDEYHKNVWPEIQRSLSDAGIKTMEIYRAGNRLFMIIEVTDTFSFEKKAEMDRNNPKVQEWENLMSRFQQTLPFAKSGQKWVVMDKVFNFKSLSN